MLLRAACRYVDLCEPARESLSLRLRPRLVWRADRMVLQACAGRGLATRRTRMVGDPMDCSACGHADRRRRAVPVHAVDLADHARDAAGAHRARKARGPGLPGL